MSEHVWVPNVLSDSDGKVCRNCGVVSECSEIPCKRHPTFRGIPGYPPDNEGRKAQMGKQRASLKTNDVEREKLRWVLEHTKVLHYESPVVLNLLDDFATLTDERDSAKRELAEFQADATVERTKYTAMEKENAALKEQVERLDWQPITPENLPIVVCEVYSAKNECVTGPAFMRKSFEWWTVEREWTHFRPINAPARTAPAKETE